MHLRVVAVGCEFGIVVTLADGNSTSAVASDSSCIPNGRPGLRSSLTSARWKNLRIGPAQAQDLNGIAAQSTAAANIQSQNPRSADSERYLAELRDEARKHAVKPGVQTIASFMMAPGRYPNVTLQGVVVSNPPLVELQDDTGAMMVQDFQSQTPLKLGDVVEARGTVISERFRSLLAGARIRVLWSDMPIPPLAVTASQLTGGTYRGRAITIEGTLVSADLKPGGYALVLRDEDYTFRALGSNDFRFKPSDLEIGSRLRLRGTATSREKYTDSLYPFAILTDQVDVVSRPPWWSTRHLVMLLALLCGVFASVQFLIHRIQRWHLQSVLHEREMLAYEMHDTLAQSFTGIAYQLQAAGLEKRGESQVQEHIRNALQMVHLSHKEASRTISSLRPQYRDAAAIVSTLRETAGRISDGGELHISASLLGKNSNLPLAITDAIFRIGQEAISNAIQHAECKTLTIELTVAKRLVSLRVHDDGKGFPTESTGLGIRGMKSRAEKIKAEFEIASSPGQGTTILVNARLRAGGLLRLARNLGQLLSKSRTPEPGRRGLRIGPSL